MLLSAPAQMNNAIGRLFEFIAWPGHADQIIHIEPQAQKSEYFRRRRPVILKSFGLEWHTVQTHLIRTIKRTPFTA